MKIIDSQIHAWYPNTSSRPWPEGAVSLHGDQFTIEQTNQLLDAEGVDRVLLVPPMWTGWDNAYSLDAAARRPDRFGVMGRFDIDASDARARLATWRQQPGMLGIRIFFGAPPLTDILSEPRYAWFWQDMEALGMPFMSTIPGNIAGFEPVLAKHPKLRLIVDHGGRHPRGPKDEAAWTDAAQLHALARFENVSVKVSSLPCFSTEPYPFVNLHRHIHAIYDHFGPQRMLWGSDATRLTSSYGENLRLFTEALDFLSEDDKSWVMGRAAAKWCDWPL